MTHLKRPVRIYLDQKDFGRIADAVLRGDHSSPDVAAYGQLKPLVAADEVRVYFSFVHVVEALRFGNPRSETALAYCQVVDALTQGQCIRFPPHLQRAELDLALAELSGSPSNYVRDSYAYGMDGQAVTPDGLQLDPALIGLPTDAAFEPLEEVRARLKAELPNRHAIRAFLSSPPAEMSAAIESRFGTKAQRVFAILLKGTDSQRRSFAESLITNEHLLRKTIGEMSEDTLNEFRAKFPATGFAWTRALISTALTGPAAQKGEVWSRFLDGVMGFTQLVSHYSLTLPELPRMGTTFDDPSLVTMLRLMQQFEPLRAKVLGTSARWDREIAKDLGQKHLQNARDDIRVYANEHGLSPQFLERQLQAEGFKRLPYIRATTLWVRSYLARHKGPTHARKPEVNDFRDLLHCVNAPYVDILAADHFAAEVASPLAKVFGTRIVRSLTEVVNEVRNLSGAQDTGRTT